MASVLDVQPPPEKLKDAYVHIIFTVHSPASILGTKFVVSADSRDAAAVRREFPVGKLFLVTLPTYAVDDLGQQVNANDRVQKQIDSGIDPKAISEAIHMRPIRVADLPSPPVPYNPAP